MGGNLKQRGNASRPQRGWTPLLRALCLGHVYRPIGRYIIYTSGMTLLYPRPCGGCCQPADLSGRSKHSARWSHYVADPDIRLLVLRSAKQWMTSVLG